MGDDGTRRRRPTAHPAVLTPPTGLPVGPSAPVVPARPVRDPCACDHARVTHEHWRRGSDCGICGPRRCPRFRRRGGALRRLLRRARLVP